MRGRLSKKEGKKQDFTSAALLSRQEIANCLTTSVCLKMEDDHQDENKPNLNFPENPFSEQDTVSSDPESNDGRTGLITGQTFGSLFQREYSPEQNGGLFGGRRVFGSKAKARGTLSMSSGSSMDPNTQGPESSLTDGITDGELNVPTNCEVSTQTDIFLPSLRDSMESEQPLQKEDEPPEQADDKKEGPGICKEKPPLVIIVKAKPQNEKECLFYSDCFTEDKEECEIPTQIPIKESIICEDTDKVRLLHYFYHRVNSPSTCDLEKEFGTDCLPSSVTTTSQSFHQNYAMKEFAKNFESFRDPHLECHQNTKSYPGGMLINELPISEEIKNLQRSKTCCDEEKSGDHPSIVTRFPSKPDFVADPAYGESWYYSRFRKRIPGENVPSVNQPERKMKVEDIFETAESTDTLDSNDCLQYTSSQTGQEEHRSNRTNITDHLSQDLDMSSVDTVNQNIKMSRLHVANERKTLQNKIFQRNLGSNDKPGNCFFPKATGKSHNEGHVQNEAQGLKGVQLENNPDINKTPKKKPPRQKVRMDNCYSEDDASRKNEDIPQGKWVENLSDEVRCEKHALDDMKKKGKFRQMYKFVKDHFRGKR